MNHQHRNESGPGIKKLVYLRTVFVSRSKPVPIRCLWFLLGNIAPSWHCGSNNIGMEIYLALLLKNDAVSIT